MKIAWIVWAIVACLLAALSAAVCFQRQHTFAAGPEVVGNNRLYVFWQQWCVPCRQVDAEIAKLSESQRKQVVRINIWGTPHERDVSERYKIKATPTLIVVREYGVVLTRHVGFATAEEIGRWLK